MYSSQSPCLLCKAPLLGHCVLRGVDCGPTPKSHRIFGQPGDVIQRSFWILYGHRYAVDTECHISVTRSTRITVTVTWQDEFLLTVLPGEDKAAVAIRVSLHAIIPGALRGNNKYEMALLKLYKAKLRHALLGQS